MAQVPFVDALTTMLDPTLPLTVVEWDEWGDPEADPEVYDYMAGYAPYENVVAQATTRRSWPRPPSTTPGSSTSSPPSGWPGCGPPPPGGATCCSRPRCRPATAGVCGRYKAWRDRAFSLAWMLDRMGLARRGSTGRSGVPAS